MMNTLLKIKSQILILKSPKSCYLKGFPVSCDLILFRSCMKLISIEASEKLEEPQVFFENLEVGEWLTSAEAARFLGLTTNALRIKVCRGQIKFKKLGSRLRFCKCQLNSLLQKGA